MSHLNPCPDICDPPPPRWCISSIQVPRNCISIPSMSNLKPIRISRLCVSPISRPCLIASRSQDSCISSFNCTFSPSSRPRKMQINSIQAHIKLILVSGCVLHLHPHPASPASQVPKFLSHLQPCTGLFQSRSKDSYLHIHPCTVPLPLAN